MSTTVVPSRLSRLWGWVHSQTQSLSGVRDLLLVVGGACYAVGYLVWSVNAWHRNLGLLPALRVQYLIAGAIPMLLVAALQGAYSGLFRLRDRLARWLEPGVGVKRYAPMTFMLLSFVFSSVFVIRVRPWADEPVIERIAGMEIALVVASVVVLIVGVSRRLAVPYSVLLGVTWAVVGISWFTLVAYPGIPQELGGVHPRRAVIYLSPADRVALEVLAALEQEGTSGSAEIRSDGPDPEGEGALPRTTQPEPGRPLIATPIDVDVYFADSNILLVKPVGEERSFRSPTYEIRRQGVAAISWQ